MKNSLLQAFIPSFKNIFIWLNAIVMLVGVFHFGWKPEVVVVAYFLETIIIGVIHVFKMLIVLFYSNAQRFDTPTPGNTITGFAAIPFFIFHYFFFIFIQSVFIFLMISDILPKGSTPFNVFGNYAYLLAQHDVLMAFLALVFSNVAITLKDFFLPGIYKEATVSKLFMQPYVRIFIQQFVTIIAVFFMMLIKGSIAAAFMIIVFRLCTDLIILSASQNSKFKNLLINKLKKNQSEADADQTEDSINSFLQK
ncbi:hypothetical protein EZJ43_08430 [Pedobacter changchengzhani]|uniref:Uncharacterized protein n=1 Tax=Pedobacter changchengzhani TaxID=2529274 RepID=A0A4V6PJ91_9SPHI|nr:DUF6498-containing protein [Pedobacter changchengzhani]TDG36533.1 hypothetical protein EZJ43_08430 [Pedobacter changchengzhani]